MGIEGKDVVSIVVYFGREDGIPLGVTFLEPWKPEDAPAPDDVGWFWRREDGMDEYVAGPFETERHAVSNAIHTWTLARKLSPKVATEGRAVFVTIDRPRAADISLWDRIRARWDAYRDMRREGWA